MNLTITNQLIITEAKKLGIRHTIVSAKHNLVQLKFGRHAELIRRSRIGPQSGVLSFVSDQKDATYAAFKFFGFAVPRSQNVDNFIAAQKFAKKIGWPVVVKPENGRRGNGVTVDIENLVELKKAFACAAKFNSREIIVQKFIPGDDFRVLCVDDRVFAVARRLPARVFGDGRSTVRELIERENENPLRGVGHTTPLTKIKIDAEVRQVLAGQKLTLAARPAHDREVLLRKNANLSTGGTAEDVTNSLHGANRRLFEKMARSITASLIGIDICARRIDQPLTPKNYAVIEINNSPGIRMHHFPTKGKSRNVARAILRVLFPEAFKKPK